LPVPVDDVMDWAKWYETSDRRVDFTELGNGVHVSTVFLGLDHNWFGEHPLLFETMVFVDGNSVDCERCETWHEAEWQHRMMVAKLKAKIEAGEVA
jgi:hypothetical protein